MPAENDGESVRSTSIHLKVKAEPLDCENDVMCEDSHDDSSTDYYEEEMRRLETTKLDEFEHLSDVDGIKAEINVLETTDNDGIIEMPVQEVNKLISGVRKTVKSNKKRTTAGVRKTVNSNKKRTTAGVRKTVKSNKKRKKPVKPKAVALKFDDLNDPVMAEDGTVFCPLCEKTDKTYIDTPALKQHVFTVHWAIIKDKLVKMVPQNTEKYTPIPMEPDPPVKVSKQETARVHKTSKIIDEFSEMEPNEDGKFACPKCTQTFTLRASVRRHVHNVHMKLWKDLQCQVCSTAFHSKLDLERHELLHTGQKPMQCPECGRCFAHPSYLRKHRRQMHGDNTIMHQCDMCDKQFARKYSRDQHLRTHTGEKPYECQWCHKRFGRQPEYKVHLAQHSDKRIPCPYCEKTYSHNRYLNLHIRGFHNTDNNHECPYCHKKFLYKYKLVSHACTRAEAPPPPRNHLCHICGRTYICGGDLSIHLRRHGDEKRFVCPVCGKRFKETATLKKHKLIHSRVQPTCGSCGRVFCNAKRLLKHEQKMQGQCIAESLSYASRTRDFQMKDRNLFQSDLHGSLDDVHLAAQLLDKQVNNMSYESTGSFTPKVVQSAAIPEVAAKVSLLSPYTRRGETENGVVFPYSSQSSLEAFPPQPSTAETLNNPLLPEVVNYSCLANQIPSSRSTAYSGHPVFPGFMEQL